MTKIIVIGGGHNGLVCAAYLAKAGNKVTVLEAADRLGGAAATREFAPGFRASVAHLLYLLDRDISKELALESHGLRIARPSLKTIALADDGNHITISDAGVDGGGLPRITYDRGDLISLAKLALKIRMMGRDDMREFLRITGINIYDILKENFENPLLKGALSLDAVLGTNSGPRSNNTVFTALHRMSGNTGGAAGSASIPAGGMGAVIDALAAAAKNFGAEIRTDNPVNRILMVGDAVSGVQLANGEQITGSIVVSNADPKTTIMDLLGARHVEAGFAQKIGNIRTKGNAAKLHLALNGLPDFKGVSQDQLGERLVVAPTVEYVERAFNHSKYGEFSAKPVAEITIPSIHDSSLAPNGKHVLSAIVQYAPRELGGGWGAGKAAFTEQVMEMLTTRAPGIREKVAGTELLTPQDIENDYRMPGGHWHHGEMSLDQFLMMRPVPKCAQYVKRHFGKITRIGTRR
jgi:phytoene dehydrogenase-like protein